MDTTMEHHKTAVYSLHLRAFDRKPDPKAVTFWAAALHTGEKTEADLVAYVVKSVEYHSRVMAKFKSAWLEIVGTGEHVAVVFDDFFAKVTAELKIVSEEDIIMHIKSSEPFVNRATALIATLFTSKTSTAPLQSVVDMFLVKFQAPGEYTICMLEADIDAFCRGGSEVAGAAPEPSKECEVVDAAFPNKSAEERQALAARMVALKADDAALLDVLCAPAKPAPIDIDHGFVTAFEAEFGRPIYIQEYAKYFEARRGLDVAALRRSHTDRFHEVHNMHQKYFAQDLTEHAYVCDFLDLMDDPEFFRAYSADIVYNPAYVALMTANISKRYTQVYDEQLEAPEVAYIFERVQAAHLELDDSRLGDHLLAFKSETDEIVKRVYKLYMDIYERTPDRAELFDKFTSYRDASRAGGAFEAIDERIERELMACLEFHDIVKKRIRAVKEDMPVSELFKVLTRVLGELAEVRIANLDDRIRALLP